MENYCNLAVNVSDIPWKELSRQQIDYVLEKRIEAFNAHPSPKREGYVIERVAEIGNLYLADANAQKGGKAKRNKHILFHNDHQEEDLRKLQLMILTLDFPTNNYRVSKRKSDSGKVRDLIIMDYFPWRITPHAYMQVIGKKFYNHLIYDTCACIKGKGLHFAAKRMKTFLRRYDLNYYWQADYKKFYQAILHKLILNGFSKMFKDKQFLKLIELDVCFYESCIENVLNDERRKRYSHRKI